MRKMIDVRFWAAIGAVVVIWTAGMILFKYGVNEFGTITFERLMRVELSMAALPTLAAMMIGVVVALWAGYNLKGHSFALTFLLSPAIILALTLALVSRFLIGIPLSMAGVGLVNALLSVLTVMSTALASAMIFGESFSPKVLLGFLLGAISILLIGET